MKKYILSISIAFGLLQLSNAQITIQQSDFIQQTGVFYPFATDASPTISIGGTGNQTWNYAGLAITQRDTILTTAPAGTPFASSFTSANMCLQTSPINPLNYYYYTFNNDSLTSPGDAINDYLNGPVVRTFTPEKLVLKFPMNYTDNYSREVYRYGRFPYPGAVIDSIEEKKSQTVEIIADAYGSMTTPLANYNVLRVKETIYNSDSIFKHDPYGGWQFMNSNMDTTVTYSYWTKSLGIPVVRITANFSGTIQDVFWLEQHPTGIGFSINELTNNIEYTLITDSEINKLLISTKDDPIKSIVIYNTLGAKVMSRTINNEFRASIDISSFANGVYIVQLETKTGKLGIKKTFIGH